MAIEIKPGRKLDEHIAYVALDYPRSEPSPVFSTDPVAAQLIVDRLRAKGFRFEPHDRSPFGICRALFGWMGTDKSARPSRS